MNQPGFLEKDDVHTLDELMTPEKTIRLNCALVTFNEMGLVELHFDRNDEPVTLEEIEEVFERVKSSLQGEKTYLLVSTIEGAKMSTEARNLASSDAFNSISHADAIIRTDYSHEMAANFFIRVNKPERPVKLFPDREQAIAWIMELKQNQAHT
jgi:hypothetical protein